MTLARREGREACPLKSVIMCFFAAAPARRRRPRRIALHIRVRPARMLRRDNGNGPPGLGRTARGGLVNQSYFVLGSALVLGSAGAFAGLPSAAAGAAWPPCAVGSGFG